MIEKLSEYEITSRDGPFINADCNTKIINTLIRKINELVDAVNGILDYAPLEMAMKVEPKTELERTRKALDVAVDMLKEIDKTRSVANHKIGTQDKTLNSGIVFCWATPDEIHNALEQITAEQKDK